MRTKEVICKQITRAKRKLTSLRKADKVYTDDFDYWLYNLNQARQELYNFELAIIAAKNGPVSVGKLIAADGGIHIRVSNAAGAYIQNIDKSLVPDDILENMPVAIDNRIYSEPCAVIGCDSTNTQRHHFAPRHLFEDAENWPTAYLCKYHHELWHSTIVKHWTGNNGH